VEGTSNSASTITQAEFVQVFFWDSVHLLDFGSKGRSGPLLSRSFTINGFMPLFTAIHTKIVVKAVLSLFRGEFPLFLKRGMALSLGGINLCVTVFHR